MSLGLTLIAGLATVTSAPAATASLPPIMDTSLMEGAPNNNTGTMANLVSGSVANGRKTRALLRFDVAGSLPSGAVIEEATLRLTVLKSPPGEVSPASHFGLHRVLVDWIEGTKGGGNTGALASDGEPTWIMRSVTNDPWTTPGGGLDDTDFASAISSQVEMDLPGSYTIPSTPELVADVQSWICHPAANFGWALISDQEAAGGSARRMGSRETGATQAPVLTLTYSISAPEIKITDAQLVDGALSLRWTGNASEYQIQQRTTIDGPWTNLGDPVGCEKTARIPIQQPASFLRVISR